MLSRFSRWPRIKKFTLKSDACFKARGFDLAYALQVFLNNNCLVRKDHRWDYGKDRFQILGRIEDRVYVLVYTLRSKAVRVISARKANQREVMDYENSSRKD